MINVRTISGIEAPDLVIAGTNEGQNLANVAFHSGTVGAAATAINEGVPAIAISTATFGGDLSIDVPYEDTADFLVQLVGSLEDKARGGDLLPEGTGLNVNYPRVAEPTGVTLTGTGAHWIGVKFAGGLPEVGGVSDVTAQFVFVNGQDKDSDAAALDRGEVAVAVITGNYDLDTETSSVVLRTVKELDRVIS